MANANQTPATPAKPAPQAAPQASAQSKPQAATPAPQPQAATPAPAPQPAPQAAPQPAPPTGNLPVGTAPTGGGRKKQLGPRPSATLIRSYNWQLTTINLVVAANPKGGASAVRYGLYRHGMTIAALVQANTPGEGKRAAAVTVDDITWDLQRGYITLNVVMPVAPAPVATGAAA